MTDAVRAVGLTRTYGSGSARVVALDDVSLTLERGTVSALLGPSGSGKSTLITALGFVSPANTGEVFFEGRAVVKDGVMHVQAGAGIVADSDPDYELAECRAKAGALIAAAHEAVRVAGEPGYGQ